MNKDNSFPKLNMKDYHHLRIHQFMNMLTFDYDESIVVELTKDFCLATENPEDMRIGMEFLYINGYYNDLKMLINKNRLSHHSLNQKWASVFDLTMDRAFYQIPPHEILKKLNMLLTPDNDPELQSLIYINIINTYFDMYLYGKLGDWLEELQELILKLENPLVASFHKFFLDLIFFAFYWKRNEMVLSRKYGFRVLNKMNSEYKKAQLHVNLSLTYIFDDFDSSIHHLNEARSLAIKNKHSRLINMIDQQNYPFICAHFNRPSGITTKDISEQAHLEIAKGDLKKAQQLLSGITEVTPFTKYYLGRAYQDRKQLISSYNDFVEKRSDYFFARLPLTLLT